MSDDTHNQRDVEREVRTRVLAVVLRAFKVMDDTRRRVFLAWLVGQLPMQSLLALELRLQRRGVGQGP